MRPEEYANLDATALAALIRDVSFSTLCCMNMPIS